MARAQLTFRQGDVMRAIRAAKAAGMAVGRVEIDKAGKIIIVAGSHANSNEPRDNNDGWDDV